MPCNTRLKANQTVSERVAEVKKDVQAIDKLIAAKKVTVKVGPQGAIAFLGLSEAQRDGMTDGCIYRTLTNTGSVAAREAIRKAEMIAGRGIDRKVIAQGLHSHDGGATWHPRG